MAERRSILPEVLGNPDRLKTLTLEDWDVLIPQARATRLMGRLAVRAEGLPDSVLPAEVRWHLAAARISAGTHAVGVKWETVRIDRVLSELGIPVVLLKGPAYMLLGLPLGRGRICQDIDLLVPRDRLADVERCLLDHGWEVNEMEPHQERYFREWLHELPALIHRERGTKLDVHHNILPRIDSIRIDADILIAASLPLEGYRCLRVLTRDDMLLHSAAHLFRRGLYHSGLRDLADMDGLTRMIAGDADWDRLLKRTSDLRLGVPLFLAVRYMTLFLGTPIPPRIQRAVRKWRPLWPPLVVLDGLVRKALLPPRLDGRNRLRAVSQWILVRYPLSLWRKSILPKLGAPWGRKR
jgi:hypothetical protein